jgi:hypothetical protein
MVFLRACQRWTKQTACLCVRETALYFMSICQCKHARSRWLFACGQHALLALHTLANDSCCEWYGASIEHACVYMHISRLACDFFVSVCSQRAQSQHPLCTRVERLCENTCVSFSKMCSRKRFPRSTYCTCDVCVENKGGMGAKGAPNSRCSRAQNHPR